MTDAELDRIERDARAVAAARAAWAGRSHSLALLINFLAELDRTATEFDALALVAEVRRLRAKQRDIEAFERVVRHGPEETVAETEALEPGRTALAARAIDIWNLKTNAIAKARENCELRARVDDLMVEVERLKDRPCVHEQVRRFMESARHDPLASDPRTIEEER
jgi:hypothetical protein